MPRGTPSRKEFETLKPLLERLLPEGVDVPAASAITQLATLWKGFGQIWSIEAKGTTPLVLKLIDPPVADEDDSEDESTMRKLLSYAIEAYFYAKLSPSLPANCAVPTYVAHLSGASAAGEQSNDYSQALLLHDVRTLYPNLAEARGTLDEKQTFAALDWLAAFHRHFRGTKEVNACPPPLEARGYKAGNGVWQIGGYSYLATRMDELSSISANSTWSSFVRDDAVLSHALDSFLRSSTQPARTLVHGDIKAANMAFNPDTGVVALYDFQYVGFGLGTQDLAKLFTSSVPAALLQANGGEERLLRYYWERARIDANDAWTWEVFIEQWQVALLDWTRFSAGWGFWGNTRWQQRRAKELLDRPGWQAAFIEKWKPQA